MRNKSNVEKIKSIKPKKRKNVSQKYRNGLILQTRDEYFEGKGNFRKQGYENKGNYRKAVVVDSNRDNELAVVKLTTKRGIKLDEKSRYRPFIETRDNEDKAIKVSNKFIPTKKTIEKSKVNAIKINSLKHTGKDVESINGNKLRQLKSRNKK